MFMVMPHAIGEHDGPIWEHNLLNMGMHITLWEHCSQDPI